MLSNGNVWGDIDGVLTVFATLSSKTKIHKAIFLFGKRYDLNKKYSPFYIKQIRYVFSHVVGFYFSYKVSLKGDGMHFSLLWSVKHLCPVMCRQVFWGESFPRLTVGNTRLIKFSKRNNLSKEPAFKETLIYKFTLWISKRSTWCAVSLKHVWSQNASSGES